MEQCCVVIPSYDRPESVRKSVLSAFEALRKAGLNESDALDGTLKSVIVVDDGEIFPVQDSLSEITCPALMIVKNKGPKGAAHSRNLGASLSKSNLIFFLDDDDLLEPDYIQRILVHRSSGACTSVWGFSKVDQSKKYRGLPDTPSILGPGISLLKRLSGLGTGFWIEADVFRDLNGIDGSLQTNEDTDLCLKLATAGHMPWYEPSQGVRINGARGYGTSDTPSITKSANASCRAVAWETILSKHAVLLAKHPSLRSRFIGRAAKYRARGGDLRGALKIATTQQGLVRLQTLKQVLIGAVS